MKIKRDILRLYFDVSIFPELNNSVTGISRVLLSTIDGFLHEHEDEFEIYGISFRNNDVLENPKGKLCSIIDALPSSLIEQFNYNQKKEHLSKKPKKLNVGDAIICMGEQWLFNESLPILRQLKMEEGVKIVTLVHDLVPFFMPELYWPGFSEKYTQSMRELVGVSDLLLVYSESTKRDLVKYLPEASCKKISKIKLGDTFGLSETKKPNDFSFDKFVLCVGTIQPRKNHMLLLYAWRSLQERYGRSTPPLVIVGSKGWNSNDLLYFIENNPDLKRLITIIECPNDKELKWMYENAWLSVYPSIYEGWGLPIAESLAAGKLCLSSNTSSMTEVGLDLVKYFSPYDPMGLVKLIECYLNNPEKLISEEVNIRSKFVAKTWHVCADSISDAIKFNFPA